ncbi:MAG: LptF/LptG family permease [Alkalispirochaeta sp.]
MTVLDRLLLKTFFPVFGLALSFFVLIIELMDLFSNLVRYLNLGVPAAAIVQVQLLFAPRATAFALPVAVLFAAAYALGTLYSNNELIAVFGAGISVRRFTAPLVAVGILLSVGLFLFQEYVVIDTYQRKNEMTRELLNISRSFSNTNVAIRTPDGTLIYSAEYYNDVNRELSGILILRRSSDGAFLERIDAQRAQWSDEEMRWILLNGTAYRVDGDGAITSERFDRFSDPDVAIPPRRFRRSGRTVEELPFYEAREWVGELQEAGQPYRRQLTEYYGRFSFALTPFIVVLLSSGLGGRFKKNVLLLSLFFSLVAAVVYYVTGMVTEILAGDGVIPPMVGAWAGVVLFTAVGIVLVRTAPT